MKKTVSVLLSLLMLACTFSSFAGAKEISKIQTEIMPKFNSTVPVKTDKVPDFESFNPGEWGKMNAFELNPDNAGIGHTAVWDENYFYAAVQLTDETENNLAQETDKTSADTDYFRISLGLYGYSGYNVTEETDDVPVDGKEYVQIDIARNSGNFDKAVILKSGSLSAKELTDDNFKYKVIRNGSEITLLAALSWDLLLGRDTVKYPIKQDQRIQYYTRYNDGSAGRIFETTRGFEGYTIFSGYNNLYLYEQVPEAESNVRDEISEIRGQEAEEPLKVLFIGNSLTFMGCVPFMFKSISEGMGRNVEVSEYLRSGEYLFNLTSELKAQSIYENYDIVILQETVGGMWISKDYDEKIKNEIQSVRDAGAQPVLYMTYANSDAKQFCDGDISYTIGKGYDFYGQKYKVPVVPSGLTYPVFNAMHPEAVLMINDLYHPSRVGGLITGAVFYNTIFGEKISADSMNFLSDELYSLNNRYTQFEHLKEKYPDKDSFYPFLNDISDVAWNAVCKKTIYKMNKIPSDAFRYTVPELNLDDEIASDELSSSTVEYTDDLYFNLTDESKDLIELDKWNKYKPFDVNYRNEGKTYYSYSYSKDYLYLTYKTNDTSDNPYISAQHANERYLEQQGDIFTIMISPIGENLRDKGTGVGTKHCALINLAKLPNEKWMYISTGKVGSMVKNPDYTENDRFDLIDCISRKNSGGYYDVVIKIKWDFFGLSGAPKNGTKMKLCSHYVDNSKPVLGQISRSRTLSMSESNSTFFNAKLKNFVINNNLISDNTIVKNENIISVDKDENGNFTVYAGQVDDLTLEFKNEIDVFADADCVYKVPEKVKLNLKNTKVYFKDNDKIHTVTIIKEYHKIEFNDIVGHWAKDDINLLGAEGIINGYEKNDGIYSFIPDGFATRYESAAILARAFKFETSAFSFVDLNIVYKYEEEFPDWVQAYMKVLYKLDIMSGSEDEDGKIRFSGDDNITRAEFSKMICAAAGLKMSDDDIDKVEMNFKDLDKFHWAYKYIASLKELGIVEGYSDDKFGTDENITRAEMIAIINRIYKYL